MKHIQSSGAGIRLMERWDSADYWDGKLATVDIYNSALTAGDISARWNATSFGQLRDMLEPRLGVTVADGTPPIKIRFISGSAIVVNPNNTHAQNLSTFATSSIPWIDDGLFYNREDNPDETLLIV